MFSDGDSITVAIIWTLFAIYVFYSLIFDYIIFPVNARTVYSKGCHPSDPDSVKYKYLISIFVDNWSSNCDIKNTVIYFDLITKQETKMVSFTLFGNEIINKRANILLHRKRILKPLTRIRAIHDCNEKEPEARIHLTAIKIQDLKFGPTVYYLINQYIRCEEMVNSTVHRTAPIKIRFFSQHIFAPNFVQLRTDTFSTRRILSFGGYHYETNGVLLKPELNVWEDIAFVLFLMISILFFNVLFVIKLKNYFDSWISLTIVSTLLSSGLSFNSVNIFALFYRIAIKSNYNIYCSKQKIEEDKDSLFWTLCKNLNITYLYCISFVASLFIPEFIQRNTDNKYITQLLQIKWFNSLLVEEISFLIMFFIASLITSLTLWLLICGLIKYLYLKLCSVPTYVPYETDVILSEDTNPGSDDMREAVPHKTPKHKTEYIVGDKADPNPKPNTPTLHLGTEKLENKLKADLKNNKLMTGSVIITPTNNNSMGFVDPEMYRLITDSKLSSKPNTRPNN